MIATVRRAYTALIGRLAVDVAERLQPDEPVETLRNAMPEFIDADPDLWGASNRVVSMTDRPLDLTVHVAGGSVVAVTHNGVTLPYAQVNYSGAARPPASRPQWGVTAVTGRRWDRGEL